MGYVYLICSNQTGTYKVGVTKNDVEKRLKQLQTGNGYELHIVNVHETDNMRYIERMLHHEYSKSNTKNEWFELTDEQVRDFKPLCNKYENVLKAMKDNPFFKP